MVDVHRPQPGVQEVAGMSISVPRAEPITPAESGDRDGAIPPLESGDRLTRDEFERRYQAMPQLTKAELIEGIVNGAGRVSRVLDCRGRPTGKSIGASSHA
jgi:hypothetical protein